MITIDLNNPTEVRNAGMQALENALGRIGMVKFIQQFEPGYGNYTAEKCDMPDITLDEIEELLTP